MAAVGRTRTLADFGRDRPRVASRCSRARFQQAAIDEATGAWRPQAAGRYSANLPQPHDVVPVANRGVHSVPPTRIPNARIAGHRGQVGRGLVPGQGQRTVRACSIAAFSNTLRPGSPNVAMVTVRRMRILSAVASDGRVEAPVRSIVYYY